jgi:transposase
MLQQISEMDRMVLAAWMTSCTTQGLRARAILLAANGTSNKDIAGVLWVTERTVARWKNKFRIGGVDALRTKARNRRAPMLHADLRTVVEQIIAQGDKTVRQVAAMVGVSATTVWRVWQSAQPNPTPKESNREPSPRT